MRFSQIMGNQEILRQLREHVEKNTAFHAYLFEGPDGVGKRLAAQVFAKGLLCRHPQGGEACDLCESCVRFTGGNHPDYHYIEPEGKSIKDQVIEEVQNQAAKKPFEGERSVFVIQQADTITERAQNRLLKTLEEPKGNSVMILLVENIQSILPTIQSRCVNLRFRPVDQESIAGYLTKSLGISQAYGKMVSAFSYGSVGRAIRLGADEDFPARRERAIRCAKALGDKDGFIDFAREIQPVTDGAEAMELLDLMEYWFRDALFLSRGIDSPLLVNQDQLPGLYEMLRKTEGGEKGRWPALMMERIEQAKTDIARNGRVSYALKSIAL